MSIRPLTRSLAFLSLLAAAGCCSNPEPKTVVEAPPTGSAAASPAPTVVADGQPTSEGERKPQIAGGYTRRETTEAEIAAVANKAVELVAAKEADATLALVSIESAASQVVAGMNFALGLKVKGKAGERALDVVVYRSLQDQFALTQVTAK